MEQSTYQDTENHSASQEIPKPDKSFFFLLHDVIRL